MRTSISDDYIAGFVDGEGCFSLTVRRDIRYERKSKATYYSWKISFAISLRGDDKQILEKIREHFKCGTVTTSVNHIVRYQVSNLDDIYKKIIPFFQKNQLFGKKSKDFKLWVEAAHILYRHKKLKGNINIKKGTKGFQQVVWNKNELKRLGEIYKLSSKYKSKRLLGSKWLNNKLGREGVGAQ